MKDGRGWLRGTLGRSQYSGGRGLVIRDSGRWGILIWSEPICSILESSQLIELPAPPPQF